MKLKIGDIVAPKHQIGEVVESNEILVKIKIPTKDGNFRFTTLEKWMADKLDLSFEELVSTYVVKVEKV